MVVATALRRNWHLLPYEQLLPLIGMSRAELSYSLRADDFLFQKMGNLKPRCGLVSYAEPDAAARARAAEIKAVVEARFGDAIRRRGEPRFAFVDRIARVPEGFQPPQRRAGDGPRYLFPYFGTYDDLNAWRGPYPAEAFASQLEKVSSGWLRGVTELRGVTGSAGTENQRLALAAGLYFESVANQAWFILARDTGRRDEMARIARSEARLARALYDLALDDSRIGFESSNQYYYMPLDLVEKVVNCESIAAGLVDHSTKP